MQPHRHRLPMDRLVFSVRFTFAIGMFAATLALFVVAVDDANAEVVALNVTEGLVAEMQSTAAENRRLLLPARQAFEKNDVDGCRKELETAFAKSKSLSHPSVQLACWWIDAGKLPDAVAELERLAMTHPDRPDVRYMFAELALSQGRYFDAWTHARVGLDTLASTPPIGSEAETVGAAGAAGEGGEGGDNLAGDKHRWHAGYATHMGHQLRRTQARIADARGDWKTSAELFQQLRADGDTSAQVATALGRAAFFQDDPVAAVAHFREAAEADENGMLAEIAMATLYEARGDIERTEAWLSGKAEKTNASRPNAGAKVSPSEDSDAETLRAAYVRWLLGQNRAADARDQASRVRPSEQARRDFQYLIALADRMSGRFDSAEKILAAMHQEDVNNAAVANQLALVLVESSDEGKRGRALLLATRAVKANPNSADAISTYGWVQYRLGEVAEAVKAVEAMIQGGQLSRDAAFYIAQIKRSLGPEDAKVKEEVDTLIQAAKTSRGEFFNAFRVDQSL